MRIWVWFPCPVVQDGSNPARVQQDMLALARNTQRSRHSPEGSFVSGLSSSGLESTLAGLKVRGGGELAMPQPFPDGTDDLRMS